MLNIKDDTPVFLACGNTDMRKSINGLAAIVENSFAVDPFDQALFVFCNRQRNRLKILTWEDNGFGCILNDWSVDILNGRPQVKPQP